jgi:uncharacterized protein (DUF1501 family)
MVRDEKSRIGIISLAMLLGGGLAYGGKISSDWPGLAAANLYEKRDLRPTMRFEDMKSSALSAHYGIEPVRVKRTLGPDFA